MRLRRLAAIASLFGGLLPMGAVAPAACAAEGPHAALVVDTESPGGQFRYCVALPDGSVTGIELIQLASEQHGLQYRLGYGGNVVCQLAGVGYSSDECLKEGPEFWGYWRGDGSGGWDWSSSGAQSTTVRHGDVEGWSWGTGNDGATHPTPPESTFASVCGMPAEDEPEDDDRDPTKDGGGTKKRSSKKAGVSTGDVDAAEDQAAPDKPKEKGEGSTEGRPPKNERARRNKRPVGTRARPAPSASPTPTAASIATDPTSSEGGPPVGGVIAAVATVGLLATGALVQRRRLRLR